jgi:tetratricopeptide (TPR) repeat protein
MRPLALPLLAALAASPSTQAGQAGTPSAEDLFARGAALQQSGDLLGAIEAYQDGLVKEPDRIDARSSLGAAYARLGRYEEAVREYRRALEVEPHVGIRFNLGLALYKSAFVAQAADEFQRVLDADPKNKAALLLLADCQLQLGHDARVIDLLQPREGDLGEDPLYCYLLGNAFLRRNEFLRGQTFIDRLFREGETAPGRLLMGVAHLRRDDAKSALPDLERAIELDPKLLTVHSLHGRALMGVGRRLDAQESFRRELALNPNDFESNLYLGLLLKDDGKLDEAEQNLKRALRLRPQDARALYGLGGLHLAAGRLDPARDALSAVTKAVPDYAQAHTLLATVYYRQKQKDLGDQHKAIAERLREQQQAQEPGASDALGPGYRGDPLPDEPARSPSSGDEKPPRGDDRR